MNATNPEITKVDASTARAGTVPAGPPDQRKVPTLTGANQSDGNLASTTTGTQTRNLDGVAIAITVFSTVRWWGPYWLKILFAYLSAAPKSLTTLRDLSFIHFARWTIVRDLPRGDHEKTRVKLKYPHLLFESNFNGGWEEYIDAFSYVLTPGMAAFWGSSYGFPGALPTGRFKSYIHANEVSASHYYSAYPDYTTTMVVSALELDPKVAAFRARAVSMSDEQFAAEWSAFLTASSRNL